ncbi:hypothetical protein FHL15_010695 [Xylaria flabelliformis]|uniref:Rhodopsin domain-containing protein n=1 Tax=Xylaria flabelliformis TaxID=2512241 RepID=A0A553HKA5_9PEZI|nr:hypothetical protein FHL15_010695 [Xylaria flabelliformis]
MSAIHASADYVGWRVEVFIGVFTPLTVLLVALRFYARSLTASRYGFEDWLVLFALLAQLLQTGVIIGSIKQGGVGLHIDYLEETQPEKITIFLKYLVAESIWYLATIWIAKLSICILYRRLFPGRWVYVVLCIVVFIMIGTSIATVITLFVACRPFSANWGPPEVQQTHCIDKEPLFVWGTLPNVITDAILLIIPLPIVWKLHMATNLKMALTVTFLIGGIGLVASILRLASFHNTHSFTDPAYNGAELQIWTLAEGGIYIISASLLVCRPLLEKIRGGASLIRSKRSTAGPSGGDYELGRAPYGRQRGESQQSIRKNDDLDHLWTKDDGNKIGGSQFVEGASYGLKNSQKLLQGSLPHHGDPGDMGITRTTVIQQSWGEAR